MHIYKFQSSFGSAGKFNYGQAKVNAMFHAIAGNAIFVSEAFNEKYPRRPDRTVETESARRPWTWPIRWICSSRKAGPIWNMPARADIWQLAILAVFNYIDRYTDNGREPLKFSTKLNAARDLRLDPKKSTSSMNLEQEARRHVQGQFHQSPGEPYDCDIYSIVEKQDRPC